MLRGAISLAAIGIFSLVTLAPAFAQDSAKKDQNPLRRLASAADAGSSERPIGFDGQEGFLARHR